MKILKTLMEQKGMEIPAQPVVYVLCREYGEYSDYGMTVEKVFVSEAEAKDLAYEYNNFFSKLVEERILQKITYPSGSYESPQALAFLEEFGRNNPLPKLAEGGPLHCRDLWWHKTWYSVHEVEAQ